MSYIEYGLGNTNARQKKYLTKMWHMPEITLMKKTKPKRVKVDDGLFMFQCRMNKDLWEKLRTKKEETNLSWRFILTEWANDFVTHGSKMFDRAKR